MAQDIGAARAERDFAGDPGKLRSAGRDTEAGPRGSDHAILQRAEARFGKPDAPAETEAARAERELRERTERLRAARLAQEEVKRKGAEIRAGRRRGP